MAAIQYIAYQIQTAASGDLTRADYPGLSDDGSDIEARAKIMLDAIEAAAKSPHINAPAIKLFMAPEFYFRGGKAGAYAAENIEKVNEFFDEYLADKKYQNWIFVLGTTLGRMPKDSGGKQEILNVAIVRKGGVKVTATGVSAKDSVVVYKEYVSHIDFLGPYFGNYNAFRVDLATLGQANLAGQLQRLVPTSGAQATENLASADPPNIAGANKRWTPSAKLQTAIRSVFDLGKITAQERDRLLAPVDYTISEKSASGLGGGILFDMHGVKFALEVCLDHAKRRAQAACNAADVDVHLVSSCGMGFEYGWFKTGGYYFRCDGIAAGSAQVTAAGWDGTGWTTVALKDTIDMSKNSRWIRHPGKATNLFEGGRGTVYVFEHGKLP